MNGSSQPPEVPTPAAAEAQWVRRSIWLGRTIVVCAVIATVATLVVVERFGQTYEDGLAVTSESAELVADAVVPLQLLAGDLQELAESLEQGIEGARTVLATTGDTVDAIGVASATNLADTARGAAGVADDLAGVIETIERFIPGNTQSAAEELRTLADGLEPVADQLADLGAQLQTGAAELAEADATLVALSASVADVANGIDQLTPTLERLESTAIDLVERAQDANDRVGVDLWLVRIVVVVLGVALVCAGLAIERFARHLELTSAFVVAT